MGRLVDITLPVPTAPPPWDEDEETPCALTVLMVDIHIGGVDVVACESMEPAEALRRLVAMDGGYELRRAAERADEQNVHA